MIDAGMLLVSRMNCTIELDETCGEKLTMEFQKERGTR